MHPWSDLKWWNSGERQVVEEKIDDLERAGIVCNPKRVDLYKALSATPQRDVRVAILGQDPYPTAGMATGVAFSLRPDVRSNNYPPTFRTFIKEYSTDLGLPPPDNGDLSAWTGQRGVLLWNVIPSCQSGHPLSNDWDEWRYLTGEIISRLDERGGIVFVCVGAVAARYTDKVDLTRNRVIRTSHPSPRGIRSSKTPFTGSRIFSEANRCLCELGKDKIDWRLDHVGSSDGGGGSEGTAGTKSGRILQNTTGARLGGLAKQGTSPNIYTTLAF